MGEKGRRFSEADLFDLSGPYLVFGVLGFD